MFLLLIFISAIVANFISKTITRPINKVTRNMKGLLDGRSIDARSIKEESRFIELDNLIAL